MSSGDLLAFIGLMTAMVLVFVLLTSTYKRRMEFKLRSLELKAQSSPEATAEPSEAFRRLEARVRVLERIATDKGADLAQQIEDLRGPPLVAAQFKTEERA